MDNQATTRQRISWIRSTLSPETANKDTMDHSNEALESTANNPERFQHHLVLHFDINETILVGDKAGGDTREESINKMIAKSSWVRTNASSSSNQENLPNRDDEEVSNVYPTHWHNGLALEESYDDETIQSNTPYLYTGWKWPQGCCPYYRTAYKHRAKTFTQHHGSLYTSLYDHIDTYLSSTIKQSSAEPSHSVLSHMIPAFFDTLLTLSQRTQPWTLVLRTFGSDLPDIAAAVTTFAQGKHPNYPDFTNESLVLTPDKLVQGHWRRDTTRQHLVYELFQDGRLIASGDQQVLEFLHQQTVCGIRDDYSFWDENHCEPWSGKPVWMLPNVQHIILDDNIHNLAHNSIVSIQEQESNGMGFRTLSGEEILEQHGVHMIRVPTVAPIMDRAWFLRQIDQAQAAYCRRRLWKDNLTLDGRMSPPA